MHGLDPGGAADRCEDCATDGNPSVSEMAGLDLSIRVLLLVVFIGMPVIDPRP
jgi:hypothetical protein